MEGNSEGTLSVSEYLEKVRGILSSIGFNKNEIEIYLDLISCKPSSALEISSRTKIHRSNTYDSLRRLIERGFVSEIIDENKKLFQAVEPEKIKNYIQQKTQEFDFILPQLKAMTRDDSQNGHISLAQGAFAAREALNDLLKINSPILVYGASREAVETFGQGFLMEFHKRRIKMKIPMLHIYNSSAMDRIKHLNKMKYTEARCLPKKYDTVTATVICGNQVMLLVFSKPTLTVRINNKEVAEAYRRYFDILWKKTKK